MLRFFYVHYDLHEDKAVQTVNNSQY